jgi:hypothetical protein
MKSATAVRLCKAVKAAPNLAARHDRRINNHKECRDGLGGIEVDFESRNVQRLSDDQVRAVIAAAYKIDRAFGIYVGSNISRPQGGKTGTSKRLLRQEIFSVKLAHVGRCRKDTELDE